MMAALALTLPIGFHAVGLGSTFLPLLLPLLLNGFLVPFRWAAATGAVVPLASAFLTGMPPLYPPIAFVMCAEGAVLGGVAAALFAWTRPRVWVPLVVAVAASRAAMVLLTWQMAGLFGLPSAFSAVASLLHGLPGTLLQLAVIPPAVAMLGARRMPLVEDRDGQAPVLRGSGRSVG
jgi:hypothetical protein